MDSWHTLDHSEVLERLNVDKNVGLTFKEAQYRLEKYGKNVLPEGKKKTLLDRLAEQLLDPMIILLIIAAIISIFVGEIVEAIAIIVIVVLNAVIGIYQEYRQKVL